MPTQPGDYLPEHRIAVEVEDAGDYISRLTDARPSQRLGTSASQAMARGSIKPVTESGAALPLPRV